MPLTDTQIRNKISQLRKTKGKIYAPLKYFRGLATLKDVEKRYVKMLRRDYKPFATDKGVRTKTSSYTARFRRKYGRDVKTLSQIARATKIPVRVLRAVYDRGLAAWRTGHRPGASPQAWAYARVHSFVLGGKTYRTADRNLASF